MYTRDLVDLDLETQSVYLQLAVTCRQVEHSHGFNTVPDLSPPQVTQTAPFTGLPDALPTMRCIKAATANNLMGSGPRGCAPMK